MTRPRDTQPMPWFGGGEGRIVREEMSGRLCRVRHSRLDGARIFDALPLPTLPMDGLLPEVAQQAPEPLPLFGGPLESEEQAQAKGRRDPRWWDCPARQK